MSEENKSTGAGSEGGSEDDAAASPTSAAMVKEGKMEEDVMEGDAVAEPQGVEEADSSSDDDDEEEVAASTADTGKLRTRPPNPALAGVQQAARCSGSWKQVYSDEHKQEYYYNARTRITTWQKPIGCVLLCYQRHEVSQ